MIQDSDKEQVNLLEPPALQLVVKQRKPKSELPEAPSSSFVEPRSCEATYERPMTRARKRDMEQRAGCPDQLTQHPVRAIPKRRKVS